MPFSYNPLLGVGLDKSIPLDGAGKIPSTFLPSYVDDVEEYNNLAAFPATGETGKIYVAIDTGFVYRWSGSIYVQIGVTAAAGSTTQVQFNDGGAFGGDAGLVFDKTTDALTIAGPVVHPLGAAATPSLTFTGDPNTGIYSPGADQLAISTNGTGRLFVDSVGNVGTNVTPFAYAANAKNLQINGTGYAALTFGTTDGGTGEKYWRWIARTASPAKTLVLQTLDDSGGGEVNAYTLARNGTAIDYHAWSAGGSERMRITSAGLVGLGTSAPSYALSIKGGSAASQNLLLTWDTNQTDAYARIRSQFAEGNTSCASEIRFHQRAVGEDGGYQTFWTSDVGGTLAERLRITPTGLVGIGTTSPATTLDVNGDVTITDKIIHGGDTDTAIRFPAADTVSVETGGSERARIDSSGRLLIGTSSARSNFFNTTSVNPRIQFEATDSSSFSVVSGDSIATRGGGLLLCHQKSGTIGGDTALASGDSIGFTSFQGSDGSEFVESAKIEAFVDGTPGADDMPGRLVFSTTLDGASTPTERLRITSAGVLQVADAGNITVGTTTGTKIGTATTQKLGFYNATPVVQPAAVADATDAATVITQLNALLAKLRTLGIIAT